MLANAVVGVLLLAEDRIVLGEPLDQDLRQGREVADAHQVAGIGPAAGVLEGRMGQAELVRPLGHHLGEALLGAAERFGDHDAGVVAGRDEDAVQEILDAHARADPDEHLRAAHAPGLLAHRQRVVGLEPAVLQPLQDHEGGHQLAHRGGRHRLIRVLGEQDLMRLQVDQDRRRGGRLEQARPRRRRVPCQADQGGEDQATRTQQPCQHQSLSVRIAVDGRERCTFSRRPGPAARAAR